MSPRPFSAASVVKANGRRAFVKRHHRNVRDKEGLLEEHRFPVDQAVSAIVPLEQAPDMLKAWSDNPSGFSKIMVRFD